MRSNRLVIVVGILLAVLAFVGIVVVLNQNQAAQQAGPVLETVLVATEDIDIGEAVTPDVVETREVEPDAVIGEPLRDPSQVQGQPAIFRIPAGTQVNQAAVGLGVGAENLAAQLQSGEKAISIVVDRVQGLNFLIQPGDTIDIVMASHLSNPDDAFIIRTVKTVLQNKRVLYVSGTNIAPQAAPEEQPQTEGGEPTVAAPITSVVIVFAGTDQDAEVVRFAQRVETEFDAGAASTLSVTLRTNDDEAVEATTGITLETLVDDYGVLVPTLDDIIEPEEETTEPQ
jgi:Flp pilus assembly protein CpaB